jgi:TolB-like protein
MGSDEEKAVDMLSRNRSIHQSCIDKFNGTLIKEIGDGILASFSLASEAVRCAIEIQKECKEQGIPLKIGIHEGEMIFSGSDVIGDGVNIASRLQEDAQDGCIHISASVYRDIKNKADIQTKLVGEKSFKNVEESTKVYKVLCGEAETEAQGKQKVRRKLPFILVGILILIIATILIWQYLPKQSRISEEPKLEKSIAVLPFKNLSKDIENQYFADGIMEGILNHLSKIKDLRVVSRSSTEKYREKIPQAQQIVKELDVSYYIEASVFKSEDRIRVTAQLIDATKDEHIWSEQYDRELSDLFEVMSEIATEVASEVKVMISPDVKERIDAIPTENLEAYDLYLKGNQYYYIELESFGKGEKSNFTTSIHFYQRAIELDSQFALAYVWLGKAYHEHFFRSDFLKESFGDTLKYFADKALLINPNLAEGHWLYGFYYHEKGDYDKSIDQLKKAIDLNPNHGDSYMLLGNNYWWKDQIINALINYKKAKQLKKGDPDYPFILNMIEDVYHGICDYEKTEIEINELLNYNPDTGYERLTWLAISKGEWDKLKLYTDKACVIDSGLLCLNRLYIFYMHTGDYIHALKYIEKYREKAMLGDIPFFSNRYGYILYKLGRKEEAKESFDKQIEYSSETIRLKRTSAAVGTSFYALAGTYAFLGEKEKAYQTLHEMENQLFHGSFVWYMQVDCLFESLWKEEEFKAIIQRQERKFAEIRAEIDGLEAVGEL